jgi:hypothetical protein
MYKGRRDPEVHILVSPQACNIYKDKSGKRWVEVAVPHEAIADYSQKFGTLMVDPSQVDVINNPIPMNVIRVNDDANILVSVKDDKHQLVSCEYLTPIGIIARWLKFYRYEIYSKIPNNTIDLDTPSVNLYKDYYYSGLRLEAYINRLPYVVPDYEKSFRTMINPFVTNTNDQDDNPVNYNIPQTSQNTSGDTQI